MKTSLALLVCLLGCSLPACKAKQENSATQSSPAANSFYGAFDKTPPVATLTVLGRDLFFDASISASGKVACATCHDPAHAFGPPNDLPVQPGGRDSRTMGMRAVPSLRYLQTLPPFSEHFYDEDATSEDQGPTGGRTWDGRAQSAHDQARIPLLSEFEMANADAAEVVAKVARASYAAQFKQAFGANVFSDPPLAFKAILLALEVFQQTPADFYPYDSKYDAYLRGQVQLTPNEQRGLELFNDPEKGNCASCHPSSIRLGAFPQFTDFGLIALGVPRNEEIPANKNAGYFDLGLCGPLRTDFLQRAEYCGLFKTPSLRNVALRKRFFHNGVFNSLEQALQFYVERDIDPGKWYKRNAAGVAIKFDDLPGQYRGNVNTDAPFDRKPGDKPALSDAQIQDVIAFLRTLSDGYRPNSSAAD